MKVLLAVDGSPCSIAAVQQIAQRPWPTDTEIKVLCAAKLHIPNTPDPLLLVAATYKNLLDDEYQHAQARVERVAEILRESEQTKRLSISTKASKGNPRDVILDEAQEWGANMIIVGSHGYGALGRVLLGSVSQAVLTHANCSVEIIRCPT